MTRGDEDTTDEADRSVDFENRYGGLTGCPRMSGQDPGRHYIWWYEANRIPTTCGPPLPGAPLWDSLLSGIFCDIEPAGGEPGS